MFLLFRPQINVFVVTNLVFTEKHQIRIVLSIVQAILVNDVVDPSGTVYIQVFRFKISTSFYVVGTSRAWVIYHVSK